MYLPSDVLESLAYVLVSVWRADFDTILVNN